MTKAVACACRDAAITAQAAQHGIDTSDINKQAAPCTDFFDYANGTWRASHPIPDYMDRWSKRWESGEINKEHVRDILADLSKKQDWTAGSPEQLSGDFYAACMDETQVNELGLKPAQPLLDEIEAIKSKADVERVIAHLHDIGVGVPFALFAAQDLHDPDADGREHRRRAASACPIATTTSRPNRASSRRATKYLVHVQKMFELAGAKPAVAKADAATVFAFEKRLAEASLDNVALRDPKQQDHKTQFADLPKLAPDFDWTAYFDAAKIPHVGSQRHAAEVRAGIRQGAQVDADRAMEDLPAHGRC